MLRQARTRALEPAAELSDPKLDPQSSAQTQQKLVFRKFSNAWTAPVAILGPAYFKDSFRRRYIMLPTASLVVCSVENSTDNAECGK